MGFKITHTFNYLIEQEIPKESMKEFLMEAVSNDDTDEERDNMRSVFEEQENLVQKEIRAEHVEKKRAGCNDRRGSIVDRKVEVDNQSIPDYIAITLKGLFFVSGIAKEDIDFLIVASKYSDFRHPFTAGTIQDTMGLNKSLFTFDLQGSDDIFLKTMEFSSGLLDGDKYKKGVILFTDELYEIAKFKNRRIPDNYLDIDSAILMEYSEDSGIEGVKYWSEGNRARYHVLDENGKLDENHFYYMSGDDMQRYISSINDDYIEVTLEEAGLQISDISLFFINSPSARIISKVLVSKGVPIEKVISEKRNKTMLAKFYPCMIDNAKKHGAIKEGDYIFLSSFGRGLSYGNMILKV